MRVTNPGGGFGIGGNTTSGPRYVRASRWSISGAPPSVTRAVPYTTRYSSRPQSFTFVDGTEIATRGSRRRVPELALLGDRCEHDLVRLDADPCGGDLRRAVLVQRDDVRDGVAL
jgi:hypothetical protein